MKEFKHLGVYGIIIQNNEIVLVKKNGGPYDGKLDLPGGTIEFGETPQEALIRELEEEIGINLKEYELITADSVLFDWTYNDKLLKCHHIGIFYKIINYENAIQNNIEIDDKNDDSFGGQFYNINNLKKEELSEIAIMILEKLNYKINQQ